MNAEKLQKEKVSKTLQSKQHDSKIYFVDNRPESISQKNLQKMINESPQMIQLMTFQEMGDNSSRAISANLPIQRFVGANGTNQEGKTIPFVLTNEFTEKHVAASNAEAITKTMARINNLNDAGGQLIKNGNIGNTLATVDTWNHAIDSNTDVIPNDFYAPTDDEKNELGFDITDYDDTGYSGDSSYMSIFGWNVKKENEDVPLTVGQNNMNRRVSGAYSVASLNVNININHCTQ